MTRRPRPAERHGCRHRPCRGQATAEFALVLPMFLILVLGLVQIAVVVRAQLVVEQAARAGARAAAVDPRVGVADDAARRSAPVADGATVTMHTVAGSPRLVEVSVASRVAMTVPIISGLVRAVTVTASSSMAVEESAEGS